MAQTFLSRIGQEIGGRLLCGLAGERVKKGILINIGETSKVLEISTGEVYSWSLVGAGNFTVGAA